MPSSSPVPPADSETVVLHVTMPAGGELPAPTVAALEEAGFRLRSMAPEEIPAGLPAGGGWLLVSGDGDPELLGRTLVGLSASADPWTVLVPEAGPLGLRLRSYSPGYTETPEGAVQRLRSGEIEAGFLGHRQLLDELSRIRHDTNNALTSALAEAQFMRMDAPAEGELVEGLRLVETQLKRIRDLVAELATLRAPSS